MPHWLQLPADLRFDFWNCAQPKGSLCPFSLPPQIRASDIDSGGDFMFKRHLKTENLLLKAKQDMFKLH